MRAIKGWSTRVAETKFSILSPKWPDCCDRLAIVCRAIPVHGSGTSVMHS